MNTHAFRWLVCLNLVLFSGNALAESVAIIEPGVMVRTAKDAVWNTSLLTASGDLSEGSVEKLTDLVKTNASLFGFALMASVNTGPSGELQIDKVGAAITMSLNNEPTTVSTSKPSSLVDSLSFISKIVLKENEAALARMTVLIKSPKAFLVEAPTVMHLNSKNQKVDVRYLFAIDEQNKLRIFVWIPPKGEKMNDATQIREVPIGLEEVRHFYVDGAELTFGLPSTTAFGLMDLPPGKSLRVGEIPAGAKLLILQMPN